MPHFVVVFDQSVIYQPDHPLGRREIPAGSVEGLRVSAPSAHAAMLHAARTTRGDGGPVAVYAADGTLAWGIGPEVITIPAVAAPLTEPPVGEVTEVFGA